ncbi:MAG: TonB-dependent receptor [Opitutaceae bacterium]|nr:TonB-dependent receptor [Opitutaceae bacterium]
MHLPTQPPLRSTALRRIVRIRDFRTVFALTTVFFLSLGLPMQGAGDGAKTLPFDIPASAAAQALKRYSSQSGQQLLYSNHDLAGVRTNAVKGEFTAKAALTQLLADTPLIATLDAKSGAVAVGRESADPKDPRAAPRSPSDRPGVAHTPNPGAPASATVAPSGDIATSPLDAQVRGRVFNALSETYIANARVSIEGTSIETLTDEGGSFTLPAAPVGEVRIRASYVGLQPQVQTVTLAAGATTLEDFTLSRVRSVESRNEDAVLQLGKITVVADQEMSAQALAMNEQRNSPSLKNVVAMDEYPVDGNGNIGEFLKYIPGVAVSFSGSQPIDVSVRGLPGNATPIMIDGGVLPSTASGDTRGGSLTGIPMTNVSRIEVTKVPTPDVSASTLGGSINIISKSGFERKTPLFTYNLYTTFNADLGLSLDKRAAGIDYLRTSNIGPSANFSYVHPINKSFSISVGAGYIYNYIPADQTAPFWNLNTLLHYQSTFQSTPQLVIMKNYNFGADWKLGDRNVFGVTFQSRDRGTEATTSGFNVIYGTGATGGPTFTQGASTGVGSITQSPSWLGIWSDAEIVTFRHKFTGNDWKVETNASYSKTYTLRDSPGYFTGAALGRANLIIRGDNIVGNADTMLNTLPTRYTATDRTGAAVDIFDQSQLALTTATQTKLDWDRTNKQIKMMVTRDLDTRIPLTLRAGFEINEEEYSQSGVTDSYTFRTGTADSVRQIGNYGLIDPSYSSQYAGGQIQWVNLQKYYQLFLSNPAYFTWNESAAYISLVNTYKTLVERVSAGFLRVDAKLLGSKLWIVGGVRYEHTGAEGVGPLNDPTAWLQKDAKGNLVRTSTGATIPLTNDALARTKMQYTLGGSSTDREYDGYYPSLNASYAINDFLLARFGYARTIGRPNRAFITPGVTFSAATANPQTITVNNTGLLPWTADNYDLTLESYLFKGGVGSIGVFQKDITGFFVTSAIEATPEILDLYGLPSGSDVSYELRTRDNGSDPTRIRGFEFNYKQPLTFLPHWARGVQVFLNYTRLQLDGSNDSDFTGFNPETISYGINLTRPRYSVKFLMQVQGETRRAPVGVNATTGIPENTFLWQGAKERPTLTADYRLTKNVSLYGSISDFFGGGFKDVQRRYPDGGTTPEYARFQRVQEWGYAATVGVRGQF